jgi:hypothetical protein
MREPSLAGVWASHAVSLEVLLAAFPDSLEVLLAAFPDALSWSNGIRHRC